MERLESGKTYKITNLFTDNRHIIIPDLQRDYCWGNKKHGDNNIELVSGFLHNLGNIFTENQDKSIKLGMIYAYEFPKDSERIYLCDGQQRITTLYILMGMLYRETKNQDLKNCLISEVELQDDQEPRLQYAIRESTLYFLTDLVCNFFLENSTTKVSEIKKQSWYFKEYNLDPTIQSMLLALEIIENKLEIFENKNSFSDFLLNNLEFFYFEMIGREEGEDMFVVINTTGEPLTPTENIKPILIGNVENPEERKKSSNLWEKWEKWFWNNKSVSENEADQGLNAFFVYYWQIKLLQERQWKDKNSFPLNPIQLFTKNSKIESNEESNTVILAEELNKAKSINEIEKYFQAYQNLYEELKNEDNQKVLKSIKSLDFKNANCLREIPINVILPLIEFKIKYTEESINSFLRRLRKNYFDGHKDWEERKENHIDWRHLIQLVDKSTSIENLFLFSNNSNFKEISNVPNNIKNWYNQEEQIKTELIKENLKLIQKMEDHQDFMGDLSFFLFKVHASEQKINCNNLEKYFLNYISTIDMVRRKNESKPNLANYIRLLLLINDCNKVGHIWRASRDFEGVLFSTIKNTYHLKKKDIQKLCGLEDDDTIIDFCKKRIIDKIDKNKIFNFDDDSYSVEKFIKAWLILKVANAEKENVCLSFYDGKETGVSAYLNKDDNRLLETEEFSLGNSLCGFGVRSGFGSGNYVHYTNNNLWLSSNIIDTPFSDLAIKKENRTKEQIQLNGDKINELKEVILNWQNLIPA